MSEDIPADEFLGEFTAELGTQPQIVGLLTMRDVPAAEVLELPSPETLEVEGPAFVAPPAHLGKRAQQATAALQRSEDASRGLARSSSSTWLPRTAYVNVTDSPVFQNTVQITQLYIWEGTQPFNAPYLIPDHWGAEFQVDFTTELPQYQWGSRPDTCWPGYEDAPSVSNNGFTWWVQLADSTGYTLGGSPGAAGFYGDYNDFLDECRNNSVGIGVADPDEIPSDGFATQSLHITVLASRGNDSQSRVTGVVHAVERHTCESSSNVPLTACMGLDSQLPFPGPGQSSQPTKGWGSTPWYAPDRCWYTPNHGQQAIDMGCEAEGP